MPADYVRDVYLPEYEGIFAMLEKAMAPAIMKRTAEDPETWFRAPRSRAE